MIVFRPVKYFLIRSQLNEKVLDVLGGKSTSGSRVILWDQKSKGADSQLWFEDSYGNVRPKVNEKLVLQGTGTSITFNQSISQSNSVGFLALGRIRHESIRR